MRALLCHQFGPPEDLMLADIPSPPLECGLQVRIAVRACGVNFPDVLMIQGLYQLKPPFPFSPGLEIAGDIIEVADDVLELKGGAARHGDDDVRRLRRRNRRAGRGTVMPLSARNELRAWRWLPACLRHSAYRPDAPRATQSW